MARGVGTILGVLLCGEALLLVGAVATVLPALRDGVAGAEGRILAQLTSYRAAVEPHIAALMPRSSAGDAVAAAASEPSRRADETSAPASAPEPVVAAAPSAAAVALPSLARAQEPPPSEPRPGRVPRAEPASLETTGRIAPLRPPPPPPRRTVAAMLDKPERGEIGTLQERLIELGLLRDVADDVMTDATFTALMRYLGRHRLATTASLDSVIAHMDRSLTGSRAPSFPSEVFLVGRDFPQEFRAELTEADLNAARSAIVYALSSLERGDAHAGYARRGGASFVVTPVSGEPTDRCRRFTLTIHAGGREQTGRGIRACRVGPSWHLSDG
jgi:hypothetical protein